MIPEPHVIEELKKRKLPREERIQLPLPLPPEVEPKPVVEQHVITIQL